MSNALVSFERIARIFHLPFLNSRQSARNRLEVSTDRVLGGSWVVISGVISRVTIIMTHIRGLITPLITTHEPPSRDWQVREEGARRSKETTGDFDRR